MAKSSMTVSSAFKLRLLASFLLLIVMALATVQGTDAQTTFPLDITLDDTIVWLRTHLAPDTRTVALDFSALTEELADYSSNKLSAGMKAMGIGSVVQVDGTINTLSRIRAAQTIVTGSIANSERGCLLEIQTKDSASDKVLGQFSATIKMDATLSSLLTPKTLPGYRPRMMVTVPGQ